MLASLMLMPLGARSGSDAPWQLRARDEASGAEVYLRTRGSEVNEFRAETRLRVRLSALVAVLLDNERMPAWVYRARQVRTLESHGPLQGLTQVIVGMPWPLQDREAIVAWQLMQDADSGTVTFEGRSASDAVPLDARYVRMPSFVSRWRFTPRAEGWVDVRFEGLGDPGGSLSFPLLRAFVNAAVWEAPLKTVVALREVVVRPEYRDSVLPFIREAAP